MNTRYNFRTITDAQCEEIYKQATVGSVARSVLADKYNVSDRTIGRVIAAVSAASLDPNQSQSKAQPQVKATAPVEQPATVQKVEADTNETVSSDQSTDVSDESVESVTFDSSKRSQLDNAVESDFYANTDGLTLTISYKGDVKTVSRKESKFESVMAAVINEGKKAAYMMLFDAGYAINRVLGSNDKVVYDNGKVFYSGIELNYNTVVVAIQKCANIGDESGVRRLLNFLEKLSHNPSKSAITGLYRFIEHNNIEIDNDGDIIAFKKVRQDMKDMHSGTFSNEVGNIVKMDRREVVENPNHTCAAGLHACSWKYLTSSGFGGSTGAFVKVKINPRDVVSVPTDYDGTKLRCCEYKVVERIG